MPPDPAGTSVYEAPSGGAVIKIDVAYPGPPRPEDDFEAVNPEVLLGSTYEESSVSVIRIRHVLYLMDGAGLVRMLEGAYRALVAGGQLMVWEPHWLYEEASCDPGAKSRISQKTFLYFDRRWRHEQGIVRPYACDYEIRPTVLEHDQEWLARADSARAWHRDHCVNIIPEVKGDLVARKPPWKPKKEE